MPQKPVKSLLFVSQILAGLGITVTPPNGTGIVTVAAAGAQTPTAIAGAASPFPILGEPAPTPTSNGGAIDVTGGVGGTTSGNGGNVPVTGGAAGTGSNGNGGDVTLGGGAKDGTGVAGVVRTVSITLSNQGAQSEQDTAATLTAANILTGIIESNPSGAINLQLPLATAMDTALPTSVAGDAFDFSIISIAGGTNLPTLTTNTGWTLVGSMTFTAVAGNAGRFRARKTGAGAWTLYRLS
jgi:hypothetical protein